jgi:hypothetical protein
MKSPDVGSMANWALNKCKGHYCKFSEAFFFVRNFTKCELKKRLHISYFMDGGGGVGRGENIVFEIKTIKLTTLSLDFNFRAFF